MIGIQILIGEEAVKKTRELNPDLVLDITLKGNKGGIDAAAEIQNKFGIPVIYTTGRGDDDTLKKANIIEHPGFIYKESTAEGVIAINKKESTLETEENYS